MGAVQALGRLIAWFSLHRRAGLPRRPEFDQVNRRSGVEPLRPELSGLRLARPRLPVRALQVLVHLRYRWQPSREWWRRQGEVRRVNSRLRRYRPPRVLPPVLLYPDGREIAPSRVQPLFGPEGVENERDRKLPRDLNDLALASRYGTTPLLQPRLQETDPDFLLTHRPLLPRAVRRFLRTSPYPRLAGALLTASAGATGILWFTQLQRAEANAAFQLHRTRDALQVAINAAGAYGVDPRRLHPVTARDETLQRTAAPFDLLPGSARLTFDRSQTRAYAALLATVRRLERRALRYWRAAESATYVTVLSTDQEAASLGLPTRSEPLPACTTPRCFQQTVRAQRARLRALQPVLGALRTQIHALLTQPDPIAAATSAIDQARALGALAPASGLPLALPVLDAREAAATSTTAYARAGAFGRLDAALLLRRLIASFRGRAIVVSLADQRLTCYDHNQVRCNDPISAGPATPTGHFTVLAAESSVAATYWHRDATGYRYIYGAIPDRLPFSGDDALQGAPWRLAFGPGSAGTEAAYTPDTPGSIDLPPAAAASLLAWAPAGCPVVIY